MILQAVPLISLGMFQNLDIAIFGFVSVPWDDEFLWVFTGLRYERAAFVKFMLPVFYCLCT